jgi:hypothetical protein
MRKSAGAFLASVLLGGMAAPILAQVPVPPQAQQAGKTSAETTEVDEIVCERLKLAGSRLATKRVCMRRSEWARQQLDDRQSIERAQIPTARAGE